MDNSAAIYSLLSIVHHHSATNYYSYLSVFSVCSMKNLHNSSWHLSVSPPKPLLPLSGSGKLLHELMVAVWCIRIRFVVLRLGFKLLESPYHHHQILKHHLHLISEFLGQEFKTRATKWRCKIKLY